MNRLLPPSLKDLMSWESGLTDRLEASPLKMDRLLFAMTADLNWKDARSIVP